MQWGRRDGEGNGRWRPGGRSGFLSVLSRNARSLGRNLQGRRSGRPGSLLARVIKRSRTPSRKGLGLRCCPINVSRSNSYPPNTAQSDLATFFESGDWPSQVPVHLYVRTVRTLVKRQSVPVQVSHPLPWRRPRAPGLCTRACMSHSRRVRRTYPYLGFPISIRTCILPTRG